MPEGHTVNVVNVLTAGAANVIRDTGVNGTMATSGPLWISEADVAALMDMRAAIAALEKGLLLEARGEAMNMLKTHVTWDGGSTLHAIGATFPKLGLAGTKTWAHTKGGATPLLILFDSHDGSLKAIIEAFALGQMRTASASGVATQRLATKAASAFAIIGTGKQAMTQVQAVLSVRPIRRVFVYGRDAERRRQFADRVQDRFHIETLAVESVEEAVRDANIITVVTRATEPVLYARTIAPGTHINAVGAIVPERAELAADVMARASAVVVDSVPQARKLSREMMDFYGNDETQWASVQPLSKLVEAGKVRPREFDITIFKSLGMGISDMALGAEVYEKAIDSGKGRPCPHPQR